MLKKLIRRGFHAIGYEILRLDNPCLKLRPPPPTELLRPVGGWLNILDLHTVLDVGAHTGETALAYHEFLPEARIYAFEPQPDCFATLLTNTRAVPQIRAFNCALGDQGGVHTFFKNAFAPSSSMLPMAHLHRQMFPFTSEHTERTVEVRRLDDVAPELDFKPNVLLKMDVQGFEKHVLIGAQETLPRIKIVVAEAAFQPLYEGQTEFAELYELLTRHGFKFLGPLGQIEKNPETGLTLFCDVVFAK